MKRKKKMAIVNRKTLAALLVLGIALSVLILSVQLNNFSITHSKNPDQDAGIGVVSFNVIEKQQSETASTGATIGFTVVKKR